MVSSKLFIDRLIAQGLDFFSGVPDSLLKSFCAYLSDSIESTHNIITANEGGAIGLAVGHYLATGLPGVVYMQNSGEGNVINPLASLADKDVYDIPMLLIIGWRGRPGVYDEPQHVKQGKVTLALLETMGLPYTVLSQDEPQALMQLDTAIAQVKSGNIYALVIEKDTFEIYKMLTTNDDTESSLALALSREEAISNVAAHIGEYDCIVSTTGMISRELYEYRTRQSESHERDFLTVGSMGHASQIALGIAIEKPNQRVWCFDGDGAAIMHMGAMAIVGQLHPRNYVHIIFNNGAHDSVGGQPTVGLKIDFCQVAKALGYAKAICVTSLAELEDVLGHVYFIEGPLLIEVRVKKGNRKDLGRPTTTPKENKEALMNFLRYK